MAGFCKHRVMDKCKKDGRLCIFSDKCFEPEEIKSGCQWCQHFLYDPQFLVSKGNGQYEELTFRFCPVCGKELLPQ